MAIGTGLALGLGAGASALGSWMNARGAKKSAQQQNAYGQNVAGQLRGAMQQGPSALEQQGAGMLGQGGLDLASLLGGAGGGFNTGQDALMQMLRADPTAKSAETLQSIIGAQGNPFDTSGLFDALGVVDERNLNNAAAGLRAGASGLGQRFGGAMLQADTNLRRQALEDTGVRNAGLQYQAHGDAQSRMLQALGMLQGGEMFGAQQGLNIASLLQQGGLAAGQLGLQAQGQQHGLFNSLLGAEQSRRASNQGLLAGSLQAGSPIPVPGYGNVVGGLGALIPGLLQTNMLLRGGGGTG